jgi:putative PIN family toxin of toxin-antitoxin system
MRMVLDTNVVVSGLLWDGAPKRLLRTGNLEGVELFTSTPLLVELRGTLSKSKLGPKIDASGNSVGELVDLYAKLAAVVVPAPLPRIAPDLDDDMVIGTALAAKADFLVTGDHALLSVGKYEDVRIVSVHEALDAIARAFPDEDHK